MNKELFASDKKRSIEDMVIIGIWALVVIWAGVKSGDLRGDPLTYAVIAKDMSLNNHWLAPAILGKPYMNKPPLFLWTTAFFFKVFGASCYVSKLPALIFSTIDIFMLYFLSLEWFKDRDVALLTALSFMTARWVVMNFASGRPESMLVFGLLLGFFAFTLMLGKARSGPYLFGLGFAIMVMTKFSMAFFLAAPVFIFAISRKRLRQWLTWPHFIAGLSLGALLPAVWIIYFETRHPGYFRHMLFNQTIERMADGLDVRNGNSMYLKEVFFYYYPWLIFLVPGAALIWKKRRENFAWVTLISVAVMTAVLLLSEGKMSRYLIPGTPFIAMISAEGAVHYEKIRFYARKIALYAGIGISVFLWVTPVRINPDVYHTVHLAASLETEEPSYLNALAFLKGEKPRAGAIRMIEWDHPGEDPDYEYTNYFYLPGTRPIWDDVKLREYIENGKEKILLVAPTPFLGCLPRGGKGIWTKIYSDENETLLLWAPG